MSASAEWIDICWIKTVIRRNKKVDKFQRDESFNVFFFFCFLFLIENYDVTTDNSFCLTIAQLTVKIKVTQVASTVCFHSSFLFLSEIANVLSHMSTQRRCSRPGARSLDTWMGTRRGYRTKMSRERTYRRRAKRSREAASLFSTAARDNWRDSNGQKHEREGRNRGGHDTRKRVQSFSK